MNWAYAGLDGIHLQKGEEPRKREDIFQSSEAEAPIAAPPPARSLRISCERRLVDEAFGIFKLNLRTSQVCSVGGLDRPYELHYSRWSTCTDSRRSLEWKDKATCRISTAG